MVKKIDLSLIKNTLQKARESGRKRAIHCLHNPEERVQRMVNACLYDTYITPHKHENPDKLEIFSILKGIVAILIFDDNGDILDSVILDENGSTRIVEIPPKTWHSFVVLSSEAVLYEVIDGKYDPKTHKKFAPWALKEEGIEENKKYLGRIGAGIGKRYDEIQN